GRRKAVEPREAKEDDPPRERRQSEHQPVGGDEQVRLAEEGQVPPAEIHEDRLHGAVSRRRASPAEARARGAGRRSSRAIAVAPTQIAESAMLNAGHQTVPNAASSHRETGGWAAPTWMKSTTLPRRIRSLTLPIAPPRTSEKPVREKTSSERTRAMRVSSTVT